MNASQKIGIWIGLSLMAWLLLFFLVLFAIRVLPASAGGMSHEMEHSHEMPEESREMDHSHHLMPSQQDKKEVLALPVAGFKELKITLKGPFCHKHPEEIQEELMALQGVKAVEAFNGRRYIVVQYRPEEGAPSAIAEAVDGLSGSGWRCQAVLP